MIKPIILYGDDVLRKIAEPYKKGEDLTNVTQDLFDTMYNARGAGLAAPQINLSKRIFVVDPPYVDFKKVFVNPKINHYLGKDYKFEEGCLSLPGLKALITRKSTIEIEYYDQNWEFHKEIFSGIKARVIQHEYDHLEGIMYIDYIENPGKELLSSF